MTAAEIIRHIEAIAPTAYQAGWDASGVQIAGPKEAAAEPVAKLAVMLDPTPERVTEALEWGAQFLLSHHPLGLKAGLPNADGPYRRVLKAVLSADAWLYAAHTSLDVQMQGPTSWLARALWLVNLRVIQPAAHVAACEVKLEVDTPLPTALKSDLIGQAGVATVEDSDGQLRIVCDDDARETIRQRLATHLGRTPVFTAAPLAEPRRTLGFGILGELKKPLPFAEFLEQVSGNLGQTSGRAAATWRACGTAPQTVRTVAYCPGSGADLAPKAFAMGADVYLTGDVKYHAALEAQGLILDVGHFGLEERMMQTLAERLSAELKPQNVQTAYFAAQDPFRPAAA